MKALGAIGIDSAQAQQVASLHAPEAPWVAATVLAALAEHPEAALRFVTKRPEVVSDLEERWVISLWRQADDRYTGLKTAIFESDRLPPTLLVAIDSPTFIPLLKKRMAEATSGRRKAYLAGCARALGDPPDQTFKMSEKQTSVPLSRAAQEEQARTMLSALAKPQAGKLWRHADGCVRIIVTGRLIMHDGSPAVEPKFFDVNDHMLLGHRTRVPSPIRYDAKTGRFVYFGEVFATFEIREGGGSVYTPYMTGDTAVRIEAKAAKPLEVIFHDQVPDVEITLTPLAGK